MYTDDHQIYEKGQDVCTVLAKLQESATLATNRYDLTSSRETWKLSNDEHSEQKCDL